MNRDLLLWFIIAGLLIAATGTGIYIMARGIRNKNPGNIRRGTDQWQGMSAVQTDPEYIQFDDAKFGIRAMVKVLRNYQLRHGLNSIQEIISRWAPPSENITGSYVAHVARIAGVDPNKEITIDDYMEPIVKTIIAHENGMNPYSDTQILEGIRLAG